MRPIDADALVAKLNLIFGCNDFFDETDESWEQAFKVGVAHAVKEINRAETIAKPPNDPLTLEDLREMDGEPVYDWMGYEWFVVSEVSDDEVIMTDGTIFDIDEDSVNSVVGRFYRRKPEEGTT